MELISEVQVHGLASACTSGVQTTAQNLFLTGSKLLIFFLLFPLYNGIQRTVTVAATCTSLCRCAVA